VAVCTQKLIRKTFSYTDTTAELSLVASHPITPHVLSYFLTINCYAHSLFRFVYIRRLSTFANLLLINAVALLLLVACVAMSELMFIWFDVWSRDYLSVTPLVVVAVALEVVVVNADDDGSLDAAMCTSFAL